MPIAGVALQHPYSAVEEGALTRFRSDFVDLTSGDTREGRRIRDWVIEQIESFRTPNGSLELLVGSGFGAGSFGRRTQCQPLDDIDLYLVLDAGTAVMREGVTASELEGIRPGAFQTDLALQVDGWIAAERVLERFNWQLQQNRILCERASSVGINSKRNSAYIRFGDLNVDATPVVLARASGETTLDRYFMPQGSGSTWWKATNPKEDQRRISEQNQAQGELVLPVVRVLKWWNTNRNGGRLKGIHLEVMTERALADYTIEGQGQALHAAFMSIQTQLRYGCADPTGLGPALDTKLDVTDRTASISAAAVAHQYAYSAGQRLLSGDADGAIAEWRKLLPL